LSVKDCEDNWHKITKLYYNGMADTKTIIFEDGSAFSGTFDHKILVKDNNDIGYGVWKSLEEISVNDEIILV
jgi:intein/homing endonuclease